MNVLEKSWLFEVVDRKTKTIKTSFTLVLPPNSVTIKEAQRVNIQKTLGNVHIDDYAGDNIQITLKAISGVARELPTFQTIAGQTIRKEYNHRDAFHEFRDSIMRYKERYASEYDKLDLIVYDFEDEQAYVCSLLGFTLERQATTPLRYPFTISLLSLYRVSDSLKWKKNELLGVQKNTAGIVSKIMDGVEKALDGFDAFQEKVAAVANAISDNQVTRAMNELNKAGNKIKGKVNKLKQTVSQAKTKVNAFLNDIEGIVKFPADFLKATASLADEVATFPAYIVNSGRTHAEDTIEAYASITDYLKRVATSIKRAYTVAFNLPGTSKTISVYPMDSNDIRNIPENNTATQNSSVTTNAADFFTDSPVSDVVNFNSSVIVNVTEGVTLEDIANALNIEDWIAMAAQLEVTNDDLYPGMQLVIPIQTSEAVQETSFILSEVNETHGSDIKVDDDGNLVVLESGSLAIISGIENVKRAIDRRLKSSIGSLVKHTAYGLTISAGNAGTVMALKYLRMSIEATILADPRISSLSNLNIDINNDAVQVNCDIQLTSVQGDTPYKGSIT
jgi:hypothetical protein